VETRLLIVDDSAVVRQILAQELSKDPLIHVVTYPIKPISRCCRVIRKTASVRARLDTRLRSALSPSALDCYLHCPARFFYQHVAGLAPLDAFVEEGDPADIGTLLHAILKEYFSPYINRPIQPENLDKNALQDLFSTRLAESELFGQLPFDQRLLLEKTGRYRLGRLLAAMPPTTIIGLEEPCEARVAVTMDDANRAASPDALPDVLINGRLDRIDLRQDGPRILDYKTGGMKNAASGFWQDTALWSDICDWRYFDEEAANDLLLLVAQGVNSVQLPCYLHLYRERAANGKALQAAYVALREDGEEFALFSDKMDSAQRNDAVEHQIPELIGFLVGRLVASQTFSPRPDRQCDYCPYRHACEE
jgi:ATP-dependent helicase/nuclease subunit B